MMFVDEVEIKVEAGKGGDVEEVNNTEQNTNNVVNYPSTNYNYDNNYHPIQVALSSDSLIKSLKIKGYEIDFDPHKYEYSVKVKNSVKSLDLTIVLNDKNASYVVNGNSNFKVGENTVTIVVTAEDGSTSTYTIKVTREELEDDEEEATKSSRPVLIVLTVLVIAGLIYVIFKDDEEEKNK